MNSSHNMHFSKEDLDQLTHKYRLNLINSITGIKPGNLVGTISKTNGLNLAIISSVMHLGSNPALVGFIMRPSMEIRRDTLNNINENGYFTINQISKCMVKKAHYTSVKFPVDISEFEMCSMEAEFLHEFPAPFVKESSMKIGLTHIETLQIRANNTQMIVGQVEHIFLPEDHIDDRGYLRLDQMESVGIGGLNSYYELNKVAEYPYARLSEMPDFK